MADEDINEKISIAILFSICFGILFLIILYLVTDLSWLLLLVFTGLYMGIHPFIGKFFLAISLKLARANDNAFHLEGDNSWEKALNRSGILYSSAWPVAAPPYIVVAAISALYGSSFKS
ncbi:MAG: hypothetical protein IPL54_08785 [Chitinophagaceae bacterium]|nr:hypothetical protein [Chitinophagaceae bacterium]